MSDYDTPGNIASMDGVDISIEKANELLDNGHLSEALEIFSKIIASPDSFSAEDIEHARMDRLPILIGRDPQRAVAECEALLASSDLSVEYRVDTLATRLGALLVLGDFQAMGENLALLRDTVEQHDLPADVVANAKITEAEILTYVSEHDTARTVLDDLLSLPDVSEDLTTNAKRIRASILMETGEVEAGITQLEELAQAEEISISARVGVSMQLAQSLAYHGRAEQAMDVLTDMINKDDIPAKDQVAIYNQMALIAASLGDWDKELEIYSIITNLTDVDAESISEAYINKGHVYERMMEFDNALAAYTSAVEVNHLTDIASAMAHTVRGEHHVNSHNHSYAVEDFSQAIDLTEEGFYVIHTMRLSRGRSYAELERWSESEADFLRVKEATEPDSENYAEALFNLGCLYARQSRAEQAVEVLTERAGIITQEVPKLTRTDLDEPDFENIRNDNHFREFRLKLESAWMQEG